MLAALYSRNSPKFSRQAISVCLVHSSWEVQAYLTFLLVFGRFEDLHSHFEYRKDLYNRDLNKVPLTDFFGSISEIKILNQVCPCAFAISITKLVLDLFVFHVT